MLLRAVVGFTLVAQGGAYLTDGRNLRFETGVVGLLMVVGGACLLAGFVSPAAGVFAFVASTASALSWLPSPATNLFDGRLGGISITAIAVAIICLGPGAFSIDSHLFGRREIIIPHAQRPPQS